MAGFWIPHDYEDLISSTDAGLFESPNLDGKREVGSTKEVAKDVAAMANEGGVLIYGLAETGDERLFPGDPIDLAESEERATSAVRTGVHNPPRLNITRIEHPDRPGLGYLVVVVPQSPLAPHMVNLAKSNRFYGRIGTQTMQLSGAQVEQLLARREDYRRDADRVLASAETFLLDPPSIGGDLGQLTVHVEPLVSAGRLVERAAGGSREARDYLRDDFQNVIKSSPFVVTRGDPLLMVAGSRTWQVGMNLYSSRSDYSDDYAPANGEAQIGRDGSISLRMRGAVVVSEPNDRLGRISQVVEWQIGPNVVWTIAAATKLYSDAGWVGPVRCSVAVNGLKNAASLAMSESSMRARMVPGALPRLVESKYERHVETTTIELQDGFDIAQDLLADLFEALTQTGYPEQIDPMRRAS